mgnify:FL=1
MNYLRVKVWFEHYFLILYFQREIVVLNLIGVIRELERFLLGLDLEYIKRLSNDVLLSGMGPIPKFYHIT